LNTTRERATRGEPIPNLVRYDFNDRHARVVLVAFVDAIT
jgi:hypothetical protein